MIDQEIAQRARARHKGAHRRQRFTACMNGCKNVTAAPGPVRQTAAGQTLNSGGVRLINDQERSEALTETSQLRKWSAIAVHTEDAFYDYKPLPGPCLTAQRIFEEIHIAMWKNNSLRM